LLDVCAVACLPLHERRCRLAALDMASADWNDRMRGFWMTPSRISMARRTVSSGPQRASSRCAQLEGGHFCPIPTAALVAAIAEAVGVTGPHHQTH